MKYAAMRVFAAATSIAAVLWQPALAQIASPAAAIVLPKEVVLYVDKNLGDTRFLDQLLCDLGGLLTAEVYSKPIEFTVDPGLRASPTQLDVRKVAQRFIELTAGDGDARSFKYLLLPADLKDEPYHYVFATSFGNPASPVHVGILSTARLAPNHVADADAQRAAEITALRLYKLILKSVARLAGYSSPDRCVFVFPRSLAELDAKSAKYCPEDDAALTAAGLLRTKRGGACLMAQGNAFIGEARLTALSFGPFPAQDIIQAPASP